jgi:hypothetical protein
MIALPNAPETANVRALASWTWERFTGLTTSTVTVSNPIVAKTALVWKNGSLVDPTTVTTQSRTLTLGASLVSGDVVVVTYFYRQG